MTVGFIACAERGVLEEQAVLLCRSIRRFAGRYREAPIYTFAPRRGRQVSDETLAAFDELGVVHVAEVLNREYEDYGYGNKVFVSAWAEEHLREEVVVFLDSDTVFTGEPADLDLPRGTDAAALPVSNRRLGSTGPGDPNEAYWKRLYEICGLKGEPLVRTVMDGEPIRAYFNSGLVAARRSAGLFTHWRDDFTRLMRAGHISELTGVAGMDEFSLAATLGRAFDRVRVLDVRYNYPLQLSERKALPPPWREAQLEELVHVHYRFWFNRPGFLRLVQPPLDPAGEVVRWLENYLPLKPVIDDEWIYGARRTQGTNIHQYGT